MNFTKRKGTKGVKHLPGDFGTIKKDFVDRIESLVSKHKIPDELIINWDQTGVNMVPIGQWTMTNKGDKQVKIAGSDDKRQITVLLSCAKSGCFLPPQVIYKGKTDKCHPTIDFPEDWNITHSETHWSNEDTMIEYVDKILIPYIESVTDGLPIERCDQTELAIFDVFKAHRSELLLKRLRDRNIMTVYIPPSCTDQLQPLDAIPNKLFKDELKKEFQTFYSNSVAMKIKHGQSIHEIDLKTTTIKPIHGRWLMKAHSALCENPEMITSAFVKCGI